MKKNNWQNELSFTTIVPKIVGKTLKHDVYTDYFQLYFMTFLRQEIVQKVFFPFSEYQSYGSNIKARIQIPPSPRNIQIYIYINQNSSMSARQISTYPELSANNDYKPSSTILPAISDRNFYEDLVTIILQLCKENGFNQPQLEKIQESLTQKIIENQPMLIDDQNSNAHMQRQKYPNQLKKFKKSKRWLPIPDQINLLNLIQNDLAYTRQRQSIYFALEKYIKRRQQQLCPQLFTPQPTRKQRFQQSSKLRAPINSSISNSNGMKWPPKQKERIDYKHLYNLTLSSNLSVTNESHQLMRKFTKLKTMYGHSYQQTLEEFCPVYNAIFDCTEKLIISAGQDGLIKIWSKETGLLLGNLRGHETYINKVSTSKCNKYLISTAADGIRFYCLATLTTLAYFSSETIVDVATFYQNQQTVSIFSEQKLLHFVSEKILLKKRNHNLLRQEELITYSLEDLNNKDRNLICQLIINKERILIIGFECGKIVIANYDELFNSSIIDQHEQSLITGKNPEVKKLPYLKEIQAHNAEIMEIRWNQFTSQFITGCKQGVCRLWEVRKDNAPHTPNLLVKIDQFKIPKNALKRRKKTIACNYVIWNCAFTHIIASFYEILENDDGREQGEGQIIVFSVQQKRIVMQLSKQVQFSLSSMTSIDSHPYFSNIIIACQTSGKIYIIDIYLKIIINMFQERAIHLRHPQFSLIITQCRFSQNGLYFVLGTEYGSISLYGYDIPQFYKLCPDEQFLPTDYLPFRLDDITKQPLIVGGVLDGCEINQIPRGNIINNMKQEYQYMPKNCYELYKKKIDEELERERIKFLEYGEEDLMLDRATKEIEMQNQHKAENQYSQQLLKVLSKRLKQYEALQQPMKNHYQQQLNTHRSVIFTQNLKYKEQIAETIKGKIQYLKRLDPKFNVIAIESSQDNSKSIQTSKKRKIEEPKRGGRLKRQSQRTRQIPTFNQYVDEYDEEENNNDKDQQEQFNLDQEQDENVDQSSQYSENDSQIQNNRKSTRKRSMRFRRPQFEEYQSEQQIGSHPFRNRRKLPQQQVKQMQQDYDKVKKRRKLNQPTQQQHVHTRRAAIQQNHTHEQAYCNRCKFEISLLKCSKCSSQQSQVCKNCQNCRGKGYPYICFNCRFVQNNSIDIDNFRVSNQYYKVTSRDYRRHYVPQIGQDIYFFFQGYEEFLYFNIESLSPKLIANSGLVSKQDFQLTPHYYMNQLLQNPICSIVDICYCFPLKKLTGSVGFDISDRKRSRPNGESYQEKQIISILKLKLANIEENKIFYIFYLPGSEFIYPAQSFNRLVGFQSKLNQDLIISDVFGQQIQIVQLKPYDEAFPLSRWKFTKIRKTEGKRLRNSKNNERRVNLWNLKLQGQQQEEKYEDCLKAQQKESIMFQINRIKQQSSEQWQIFSENPQVQVMDYKEIVQVPSYLLLIQEKIENNFYSSKQSLIRDIQLIGTNAIKYNGQAAPISISAAQLSERLKKTLEGYKFQAPIGFTQVKSDQHNLRNNRNKKKREINILQSTSSQQKSRQRNRRGKNNVDESEMKQINQKNVNDVSEEYGIQEFDADQDENYNIRSKGKRWNLRQPRNNRFTKNYMIDNEAQVRMTRSRNKH